MAGKTAIITGANGTIGEQIARQIAKKGYETILVCRTEQKARQLVEKIQAVTGNVKVSYKICDVSRRSAIKELARDFGRNPLHVLINNAAVGTAKRSENDDGIELQWATNVLSYFWMMEEFHQALKRAQGARVVNVASSYAGDLNLEDVEYKTRRYDGEGAYKASKQANRMLSYYFAQQWAKDNIKVNSCHPGTVTSNVSLGLGFDLDRSTEAAIRCAKLPVHLATSGSKDVEGISGHYFETIGESKVCPFCQDLAAVKTLVEVCKSYT